jgi:hypothetical protein
MSRRAFWWGLGIVTLLGAVPRVAQFGHALFGDELFTWAIAAEPGFGDAMSLMRETENTPPLAYVAGWLVAQVVEPAYAVRLLPLLAGIATVPLSGLVGARAFGPRAGLVAAALVAASPFAVYYAAEARAYAPATAAVVASLLALLIALERECRTARRWWIGVALSAALAVWAHYTAVFPLAAQFAWALHAHRDRWRPIVAAHGAAALAYAPWLPFLTTNAGRDVLASFSPVNRETLVEVPSRWAIGTPYLELTTLPGRLSLWLLAAATAVALVALALERPPLSLRSRGVLVAGAALATPLGALLYSLVGASIWNPRNLLVSLPATLIVTGALLARRGWLGVALSAVVIAVFATASVRESTRYKRPAYDALAAHVDRVAERGDPIVEHQVLVAPGPLRHHLDLWFERPHDVHVFAADAQVGAAWDAGIEAGRVFVVAPVGGFAGAELPPDTDPRFRPAGRRVESGLFDMQVVEYVPR